MENGWKDKCMNGLFPPTLYSEKRECCGCSACYAVCPKSAIYMEADEKGFVYPHILVEKCVGCCQCIRVCPMK